MPANTAILDHYRRFWGDPVDQWTNHGHGLVLDVEEGFGIACFSRMHEGETSYVYTTIGMSRARSGSWIEVHMLTTATDILSIDSLAAITHYHATACPLGMGHTVNLGRPWLTGSGCSYGLLSRPYHTGPDLEWQGDGAGAIRHLWLLPITESERNFKAANGLEALEKLFDEKQVEFMNPTRESAV